MNFTRRSLAAAAMALAGLMSPLAVSAAHADPAAQLTADGFQTLHRLEAAEPRSRFFAEHAKAAKVPVADGHRTGNGVLIEQGKPHGFYNLTDGSWGLQAGAEDFGYVVFFMSDSSVDYLKKSDGFAAGTGPSIVVINKGAAAEADTTTLTHDVYAFPFNEKGLMADLTLQGTKITHIHPK